MYFVLARPVKTQPILKLEEPELKNNKSSKKESVPKIEQDFFCLPLPKKDMGLNSFDKTIRLQNQVKFLDFNSLSTSNNQYKPALV